MELQQYTNRAIEWLRAGGISGEDNKELSAKGHSLLSATKKISDITGEKINLEGLSEILYEKISCGKSFGHELRLVKDYAIKFDNQKVVKGLFRILEDLPYGYGPKIAFKEEDYTSLEVVPNELAEVGYKVLQKAEACGNVLHGAKILKKAKEIGAQIDAKQINREKIQEALDTCIFYEYSEKKIMPRKIYLDRFSKKVRKRYEEENKEFLKEINSLFIDAGVNLNLVYEINEPKTKCTFFQTLNK